MGRPIESRALAILRESSDLKGKQLAEALGLKPETLYDYERGRLTPSRSFLERAAAAMDLPAHHVDWTLRYLRTTETARLRSRPAASGAEASQEVDRLAISLAMEWEEIHRSQLTRSVRLAQALADREIARAVFPRLRAYPAAERQAIVREAKIFQSWAVCELACHESIEAAADSADEAFAWADLGVLIADLAPGDPVLLSRVQGYAGVHRGNALRVKGQSLPTSDVEFHRAKMLWEAGAAGDPEKLLDEARVLGMEASLRRDQGNFPEALRLLDLALAADAGKETLYLRINRAMVLAKLGSYEEAISALRNTLSQLDAEKEPRLFWSLRFNLLVIQCLKGHYQDAVGEIEEVRKLTLQLGYRVGLARLVWLQGWVAAGLGRPAEAEAAFRQVRREFLNSGTLYDSALVTLELAVLLMEQDRSRDAQALVRELMPAFQSQRTTTEAFATLVLFREAVEQETLTLDKARRLLLDLRRARALEQAGRAEFEDCPGRADS